MRPDSNRIARDFPAAIHFGVVLGVFLLLTMAGPASAAKFLVVGTGGVTGVYYPAGGAICRIINGSRKEHGIRCSVEATGGSVYNAEALESGDLDLGIIQSDVQHAAYGGQGAFADAPGRNLRAILSLHDEPLTIVAAGNSGIQSLETMLGKRVNIGNEGSGQRATMQRLMTVLGWTNDSFAETLDMTSRDQAQALCDRVADAIVFAAGHPNASIDEAIASCDGVLIGIPGNTVSSIVARYPYYAPAAVPGGLYDGHPDPVETFGVKATLVASARLPDDMAHAVTRAIYTNLDRLRAQHPALAGLEPTAMANDALSIPIHSGALRYYEEAGLR